MSRKKQLITLKDMDTGEILVFYTFQQATEHINKVTGLHILPSTVYNAMKKCGTIAKKRFVTCVELDKDIPLPDRTVVEDGWIFTQFGISETVLACEKKLKWYDEERMEEITKQLRKYRCRVFWDMQSEYWKREKTRVEIYKKFPQGVLLEDKILEMKEIIKNVNL